MKQIVFVVLGCCALFLAGNAHAVTFRFATSMLGTIHDCPIEAPGCSAAGGDVFADFDGDGDLEPDLEYSKAGISFRVYSDAGSLMMADLAPTEGGHGALFLASGAGPTDTAPEQNNPALPAYNPDNVIFNQSLFYDFDQDVTMLTLMNYNSEHEDTFTDGDDFTLLIDGGGTLGVNEFHIEAAHLVNLVSLGIDATGSTFEFRAIDGGDGFYVSSFNVSPTIPEPATALLLGFGVVALGAARRRAA